MKTVSELITSLQCLADMGMGDEPVVFFSTESGNYHPVAQVCAPWTVTDGRWVKQLPLPGTTCILLVGGNGSGERPT